MDAPICMVTGSSGLIGSAVSAFLAARGCRVHGIDNNERAVFFGPSGDTRWNQQRLQRTFNDFHHHSIDVRDRQAVTDVIRTIRPGLIVHAAAQPSHDRAAAIAFDDFETNALATLNLLEAARHHCPESPFVFMSTNKVYGDGPNSIPVQEYGRYFGMPTCCLRAGCVTGPHHAGVELHGFLSYLVKSNIEGREYKIFGYKGKQVRDNIHAEDVASFIHAFWESPRSGEVYNIGGGKTNSCSILEAFALVESLTGRAQVSTYVDAARRGDHICYYSDVRKMKAHYPGWAVRKSLQQTLREIVETWHERMSAS